MATLKAFVFDMDGTLADNMGFHNKTWLQMLEDIGSPADKEKFIREATGKTSGEILRQFVGEHLTAEELAQYTDRKEGLYREIYRPHLAAVAGLHDFLRESRRQSILLAVATSAGIANIEFVIDGLGLREFFPVIVGGSDVTHGKPHPEVFLKSAEKLGVAPEECLVFEDALVGVEAARRAGMQTVVLATTLPAHEFDGLENVLQIVPDFTELRPENLILAANEREETRIESKDLSQSGAAEHDGGTA